MPACSIYTIELSLAGVFEVQERNLRYMRINCTGRIDAAFLAYWVMHRKVFEITTNVEVSASDIELALKQYLKGKVEVKEVEPNKYGSTKAATPDELE